MSPCKDVSKYPNKKEKILFWGEFSLNGIKTLSSKIGCKSAQMSPVWKANNMN